MEILVISSCPEYFVSCLPSFCLSELRFKITTVDNFPHSQITPCHLSSLNCSAKFLDCSVFILISHLSPGAPLFHLTDPVLLNSHLPASIWTPPGPIGHCHCWFLTLGYLQSPLGRWYAHFPDGELRLHCYLHQFLMCCRVKTWTQVF